jgi:hypothetical protein
MMKMEEYAAHMREIKNGSKILLRKPKRKRYLRRLKCRRNNKE